MADVVITLTIPDAKVAKATEGFLYAAPIPVNQETGEPLYTPKQWFKEDLRRYARDKIAKGLKKKNDDENPYDPDNGIMV